MEKAYLSAEFKAVAIAAGFATIYHLMWQVQIHLLPWFDLYEGVSAVFLPAGIKMLAIMVGGLPGILGVILVSISTDMDVRGNHGLLFHIAGMAIWGGAPYLSYQVLKKFLKIDRLLTGITVGQIAIVAVVTSLFSVLASRTYHYATGRVPENMFLDSIGTMLIGDIAGICIILYAAKSLIPVLMGSKLPE